VSSARQKGIRREAVLRQWLRAVEAWSLARYRSWGRSVGLGRGRRVNARYVFDGVSASRARQIAAERKRARAKDIEGLIGDRERVLVARYLGLGDGLCHKACQGRLRAHVRERELGLASRVQWQGKMVPGVAFS
jgi:hypothetical protein